MSEVIYRPVLAPREKALAKQSLICLLQGLHGMETTVELRNENSVTGKIEHVDAFMCVTMKNVTLKLPDGKRLKFSNFFVHGTNVRYIHIPDHVNIRKTIEYNCNVDKRILDQLKKEHEAQARAYQKKREKKMTELRKKEAKSSASN